MIVIVLDITAVYIGNRVLGWSLITSNTFGVMLGFIIHYLFYHSKKVFSTEYGVTGFIIYLRNIYFRLFIAKYIIYISYEFIFNGLNADVNLILSKGVSVVLPFFLLYYLRKFSYEKLEKYNEFCIKEKKN